MYNEHPDPPFKDSKFYLVLDILFLVFSILYLIGDKDHQDNFLKYVKPLPAWIMIIELWSLRDLHCGIKGIIFGLAFGSIGDILLLFQSKDIFFQLGALSFLIGHICYVPSFINMVKDISANRTSLSQVLRQEPLFIVMWMVLMTFSFWSIGFLVNTQDGKSLEIVLDVYGTVLTLLTMGGFFFFFMTNHISSTTYKAGLLFMIGCLVFFASDNFLAHGKFGGDCPQEKQQTQHCRKRASLFTYLIMVTYYVAQFMIGKGAFFCAVYFTEENRRPEGNYGDISNF